MSTQLYQRIAFARETAGLSKVQLASAVGVTRSSASQWEAEEPAKRTIPNRDNLKLIAKATGAPIGWLTDDESTLVPTWNSPPPKLPTKPVLSKLPAGRLHPKPVAREVVEQIIFYAQHFSDMQLALLLQQIKTTFDSNMAVFQRLNPDGPNHSKD